MRLIFGTFLILIGIIVSKVLARLLTRVRPEFGAEAGLRFSGWWPCC